MLSRMVTWPYDIIVVTYYSTHNNYVAYSILITGLLYAKVWRASWPFTGVWNDPQSSPAVQSCWIRQLELIGDLNRVCLYRDSRWWISSDTDARQRHGYAFCQTEHSRWAVDDSIIRERRTVRYLKEDPLNRICNVARYTTDHHLTYMEAFN